MGVCRRQGILWLCLALSLHAGLAAETAVPSFTANAPIIRNHYLQDLWLMARSDYQAGRLADAAELLQAILEQRPKLHRVRLELALIAYESLDYAMAREQVERLLRSPGLSTRVRAAVTRLLERISKAEKQLARRHSWIPSLAFGLLYDDNVNAGPLSDLVEIDNELFFVKSEFHPKADWASILRGKLAHRYRFDSPLYLGQRPARLYWESQAIASRKVYVHEKDFNLDILGLRSGPLLAISGGVTASLPLRIDSIRFGGEEYATFTSFNPLLIWQTDFAKWSVELSLLHKDYTQGDNRGREGDYRSVSLRLDRPLFSPQLNFYLGLRVSEEDTRDFNYSNDGYEVFTGLAYQPNPAWTLTFGARRRSLSYQGESALFLTNREDDQDWLNVGLVYRPPGGMAGASPTIEVGYAVIKRDSSIPLFTYERSQVYLALRLHF